VVKSNAYITPEIISLMKEIEGWSGRSYDDETGNPTIGWGHLIRKDEQHLKRTTLTREQANDLLVKDIREHQEPWIGEVSKDIGESKIAALTSFAFNVGAYHKDVKRAVRLLNEGKNDEASSLISKHTKSRDRKTGELKELSGLVRRREFEKKLLTASPQEKIDLTEAYRKTGKGAYKTTIVAQTGVSGSQIQQGGMDQLLNTNKETLQLLTELNTRIKAGNVPPIRGWDESQWKQRLRQEASGG
jgi:lysozyme